MSKKRKTYPDSSAMYSIKVISQNGHSKVKNVPSKMIHIAAVRDFNENKNRVQCWNNIDNNLAYFYAQVLLYVSSESRSWMEDELLFLRQTISAIIF